MSDAWNTPRAQLEYPAQPFTEAVTALAVAHREDVTPYPVAAVARHADLPWTERHVPHPYETSHGA